MEWQSIETANKESDEEVLLLLATGRVVSEGYYADWEESWVYGTDTTRLANGDWDYDDLGYRKCQPTHWMPLPPAPETDQ